MNASAHKADLLLCFRRWRSGSQVALRMVSTTAELLRSAFESSFCFDALASSEKLHVLRPSMTRRSCIPRHKMCSRSTRASTQFLPCPRPSSQALFANGRPSPVGCRFTIAAAFGNVHGVYKVHHSPSPTCDVFD